MSEKNKNTENSSGENEEYVTSTPAADILADVIAGEAADAEEKPQEKDKAEAADKAEDSDEAVDMKAKKRKKTKREHKKLKHGMMSTIYTVVFVAVIVLINIVATILFDKYPITFDLTQNDAFSISEESEEYVKRVDTEVSIKVFAEEESFTAINEYSQQANEVLKRYAGYNPLISIEYIDIDSNPDIVGEYSEQSISTYDIIFEAYSKDEAGNLITDSEGEALRRIRKVTLLDLINFTDDFEEQMTQYGSTAEDYVVSYFGDEATAFAYSVAYDIVASSRADEAFVSAIMAVTDPNPVVVTMLTGRNETDELSYLQTLLLANGYTVNSIDITTEEIPEDTDLCIVAAPQTDYLDTEVQKLADFLDNGGSLGKNLIYMASPYQQDTPNLDEFLAEYYVEVGSDVIYETDESHAFNSMGAFISTSAEISESFTQDVTTENPLIVVQDARPVVQLEEERGKLVTESYISSTEQAYLVNSETTELGDNGKQNYAVMASKAVFNDDGSTEYSNILVCGSTSMLADQYLMYTQFQNREYFLSVINGMTDKTSTGITIEPKVITGNIFDVNAEHVRNLKIIFIGVIPAVTLVTGLVIWLRRKNR